MTGQEVADHFRVKVQVVRDLMKDLNKKSKVIIKRKEAEVRRTK